MKTSHRHELKTNEVARQVARARDWLSENGTRMAWLVGAAVAIVIVVAGIWAWRQRTQERASAALAEAMIIGQAEIIAADSGRPPTPDSYPTTQARSEAAVQKLRTVVDQFPSTRAATVARFEAASLLMDLGKAADAEQYFRQVADAGEGIHARTARLGLAGLQVRAGKYDEAIETYRDLAARKDGDLPVDAVLMQLARAYELAGKRTEAVQTYQRVINEFPDSIYLGDARQAVETLQTARAS